MRRTCGVDRDQPPRLSHHLFWRTQRFQQITGRAGAWYRAESVTPKDRFFAFNHRQDPLGCTPEQLLENLKTLGLGAFGTPVDVDTEALPFRQARILYTGYPSGTVTGVRSEEARTAHHSAILTQHAGRWLQVWTYLLTERTP